MSSCGWASGSRRVDAEGVVLAGPSGSERIEARTVIWAAGVQASPLAGMLAAALGRDVRSRRTHRSYPDCTLPNHPEVFAIGDMASLEKLPGVAEVAMQQGLYAAKTIRRRVAGRHDTPPFKYRDLGSVATIGRFRAVASVHGPSSHGLLGWLVWGTFTYVPDRLRQPVLGAVSLDAHLVSRRRSELAYSSRFTRPSHPR